MRVSLFWSLIRRSLINILLKNVYSTLPAVIVDLIFSEKWDVILFTMKVWTSGIRKINEKKVGTKSRIPIRIIRYLNDFLILLSIKTV
jgi:hypothetical protein